MSMMITIIAFCLYEWPIDASMQVWMLLTSNFQKFFQKRVFFLCLVVFSLCLLILLRGNLHIISNILQTRYPPVANKLLSVNWIWPWCVVQICANFQEMKFCIETWSYNLNIVLVSICSTLPCKNSLFQTILWSILPTATILTGRKRRGGKSYWGKRLERAPKEIIGDRMEKHIAVFERAFKYHKLTPASFLVCCWDRYGQNW